MITEWEWFQPRESQDTHACGALVHPFKVHTPRFFKQVFNESGIPHATHAVKDSCEGENSWWVATYQTDGTDDKADAETAIALCTLKYPPKETS